MAEARNTLKAYWCIALGEIVAATAWGLQYVFFTPLLLTLGASPALASVSWIIAPLTCLFLSAYIGRCSDLCKSSLGRRRPFLAVTTLVSTVCLIVIPVTSEILSGSSAIATVLILNAVLEVTNNLQGQLIRALATDLATDQARMHSVVAASVGIGKLLGSLLPAIDFSSVSGKVSGVSITFFITAVVFFAGSTAMLVLADADKQPSGTLQIILYCSQELKQADDYKEASNTLQDCHVQPKCLSAMEIDDGWKNGDFKFDQEDDDDEPFAPKLKFEQSFLKEMHELDPLLPTSEDVDKDEGQVRATWNLLKSSRSFTVMCVVQFISYTGLWMVSIYTTAFFAENLFGGVATANIESEAGKLYAEGVRRGAVASVALSVVTLVIAPLIPVLIKCFGLRRSFCGLQLITGVSLFALYFVKNVWAATALISTVGLAWTSNNSIPYVYIGHTVKPASVGLATSVLFTFQNIPLVVSASFGAIVLASGNNFALPFLIASVFFVSAAIIGSFIPTPTKY